MKYALIAVALVLATSASAQSLAPIDTESNYALPGWADTSTAPHWGGMPMQNRMTAYHRRTSPMAQSNAAYAQVPPRRSGSTYVPPGGWADSSTAPHWGGTPMRYRGGADSGFSRTGG
jgi:hypothetical protein